MADIKSLKNTFTFGMHAGGAYKGLRYTNSLDAFKFWYSKGARFFEFDIAMDSNGNFAAITHSFKETDIRKRELFSKQKDYTAEWFSNQKLYTISTKGLIPLSLINIIELLKKYSDIIVMFDLFGLFKKEEIKLFADVLISNLDKDIIQNRLLVESYNQDMILSLSKYLLHSQIIHCVYEKNVPDFRELTIKELKQYKIEFISFPWHYRNKLRYTLLDFSRNGFKVLSKTSSNLLFHKLKANGVKINLIDVYYEPNKVLWQLPLYLSTYLKRILVRLYIKLIYG